MITVRLKRVDSEVPLQLIEANPASSAFELSNNAVDATRNICWAKGESAVDRRTVTRWFKKFHSGCKNVDDQARINRSINVDSEAVLKSLRINQMIKRKKKGKKKKW